MVIKQMNPTTQEMLSSIATIDFSMVKLKLMDTEEGEGWSEDHCDRVEREYRRYLALSRQYPDRAIVPSKVVDTFWHFHILDTQAYADDCNKAFGYFLHHYPYFGMRGEQDAQALGAAYDGTVALYESHFGSRRKNSGPGRAHPDARLAAVDARKSINF